MADGKECGVCGGRASTCRVLGHRPPGDKTVWQRAEGAAGAIAYADEIQRTATDPIVPSYVLSPSQLAEALRLAIEDDRRTRSSTRLKCCMDGQPLRVDPCASCPENPHQEFRAWIDSYGLKDYDRSDMAACWYASKRCAVSAIVPKQSEFAWLIEKDDGGPMYWTGDGIFYSNKHEDAMRFARRQDAQKALDCILTRLECHYHAKVVEHGWIG